MLTNKKIFLLLALFVMIYIAHNIIILHQDRNLYCLEESFHLTVDKFYSLLNHPQIYVDNFKELFGSERRIYNFIPTLFFYLFGVSLENRIFSNFIFLILLVFSLYKIGTMLKNKHAGIICVFQILMYPAIFGFLRIYFTPFAVTSLVSFGVYCLLSSDGFYNTKKVFLLALASVILFAMKFNQVIFIFPPIIIYLFLSWWEDGGRISKKQFFNIIFFILIFFSLIYLMVLDSRGIGGITRFYKEVFKIRIIEFSVNPFLFYLKSLIYIQMGLLGSLFFILALPSFLISKTKHKWFLGSLFIVPFIFYALYYYFSGIIASYYTIPYLVVFSIVTGIGIAEAIERQNKIWSRRLIGVYIILNIVNYLLITYAGVQFPYLSKIKGESGYFLGKMAICPLHRCDYTHNKNAVDEIQRVIDNIILEKKSAKVIFINHYPNLHEIYRTLSAIYAIERQNVSFYDYSDKFFSFELPDTESVLMGNMKNADLIINGNQFFPAKYDDNQYLQFGSVRDITTYLQNEQSAFKMALPLFYHFKTINIDKYRIDLFVRR